MKVLALTSIEGSRNSEKPIIAPGSVFDLDAETAEGKRLLDMSAVREASKEDVAVAKVKGLLIEPAAAPAAVETKAPVAPAAVETKAPVAPKGKTATASAADDTL